MQAGHRFLINSVPGRPAIFSLSDLLSGSMDVRCRRMAEILDELKRRGVFTVVVGPWITVHEEYFGDRLDVSCEGEADITNLPTPRFHLLKMLYLLKCASPYDHYMRARGMARGEVSIVNTF